MFGASKKSLPSWRETAALLGFGVLCIHFPEGERFAFAFTTDIANFQELASRAVDPAIKPLVSESELRDQLTRAGFSQADIDAGIQVDRSWATTVTRTSN